MGAVPSAAAAAAVAATRKCRRGDKSNEADEEPMGDAVEIDEGDGVDAGSNGPMADASASSTPQHRRLFPCATDSLSAVLSFLTSREFASAHRVSHQWRSAAQLASAWPQVNVDRFVSTREDPASRRVRVDCRDVLKLLASPVYSRANAIELDLLDPDEILSPEEREQLRTAALQQLPQLRNLASLDHGRRDENGPDALRNFAVAMADRLHVLSAVFFPDVGLLHQLRVLDLFDSPPLDQLVEMRQLRHLCIGDTLLSPDLARLVRYLSACHFLRSFALPNYNRFPMTERATQLALDALARTTWVDIPIEAEVTAAFPEYKQTSPWLDRRPAALTSWPTDASGAVPPAQLQSFTLKNHVLTRQQFESVCAMPCLDQLDCETSGSALEDPALYAPATVNCLARLQFLTLCVTPGEQSPSKLSGLAHCTTLRQLRLRACDSSERITVDTQFLSGLVRLEEISFAHRVHIAPNASWAVVAGLHSLRRLRFDEIIKATDLEALAPHLALLPQFFSLELSIWSPRSPRSNFLGSDFELPAGLLIAMAESASWSQLHLHHDINEKRPWWDPCAAVNTEAMVAANLIAEARHRLRVLVYPSERHGKAAIPLVYRAGLSSWELIEQ